MIRLLPVAFALAGCGVRLPEPEPDAVVPDHGWTGEDTRIAVTGSRFYPEVAIPAAGGDPEVDATYAIDLVAGEATYPVGAVTLRDYHLIDALVPEGIPPGTYDLVVTNASGRTGTLPAAYEVTSTRADHIDVDAESVSYSTGDRAIVIVQLQDPDGTEVFDDLDVVITASSSDGDAEIVFSDAGLLDQQPLEDGTGIQGRLLGDGSARIGLVSNSADLITVTVASENPREHIDEGTILLEWSQGDAVALDIDLPAEPFETVAGEPFDVVLTVVDSFGNPVPDPHTIWLVNNCGGVLVPVSVEGPTTTSVTLKEATGTDSCGTESLRSGLNNPAGQSAEIVVLPAPVDHFEVIAAPNSLVAGTVLQAILTPVDAYGNSADWLGSAILGSDSVGGVQAGGFNCFLDSDIGDNILCQALPTRASPAVRLHVASDDGTVGDSDPFEVRAGAVAALEIAIPSASATAGAPEFVSLEFSDRYGNLVDPDAYPADAFQFASGGAPVTCEALSPSEGKAWFSCVFTKAGSGVTVEVNAPAYLLYAVSAPISVINGPLAVVDVDLTEATVQAGAQTTLEFTGFDAYGNPYLIGGDGQIDVTDTSGTCSLQNVTLGPSGDISRFARFTRAGDTEVIASKNGVELGRSAPMTITPAASSSIVVAPDFAWAWVGEPARVDLIAVDAFGNQTDLDGQATLSSSTGSVPDTAVDLVAGSGVVELSWTAPQLFERLDATDGTLSGSSGTIVVVQDCGTGPSADLDFGGSPIAVVCAADDGTGLVSADLSGSTGSPVRFGLAIDGSYAVGASSTVEVTAPSLGIWPVRAMVADIAGCAVEVDSIAYVAPDDGTPAGPLSVTIDDPTVGVGSDVTGVHVTGATTCDGAAAASSSVLVLSDRGAIGSASATGAGLSIGLDGSGNGSAALDLRAATSGGDGTVTMVASSGAARGSVDFAAVGDRRAPTVWGQSPNGDASGLVSEIDLTFSEPLDSTTVAPDAFSLSGPTPTQITAASLDPDATTVTLTLADPVDTALGTWTVTAISTPTAGVRDLANNRLDGTWSGTLASYVGTFGDLPPVVDPVSSCAADRPSFRPDGDDGTGIEGDFATITYGSASMPVWWVVSVENADGETVRRFWRAATSANGSFEWDGRDESERIVTPGDYTVSIDSDDGYGNRGGACSADLTIVWR